MKRHIITTSKQQRGQFFTTNDKLVEGYSGMLCGKNVVDPFAGDRDLLKYAERCGAGSVEGYDIDPREGVEYRDSLLDPISFRGKFVLTNPPYLRSNKNKDKRVYERWGHDDLYKCSLKMLIESEVEEGIVIIPANFWSEYKNKIRGEFLSRFRITKCDYYLYRVFNDTAIAITVFSFKRDDIRNERVVEMTVHYTEDDQKQIVMNLKEEENWMYSPLFSTCGIEIGKYRGTIPNGYRVVPIVIGLIDYGKYRMGMSYYDGDPIVIDKSFTTFQIVTNADWSDDECRDVVRQFNERSDEYRNRFHGLFFPNFMTAGQKMLTMRIIDGIVSEIHIGA